MRIQIQALRGMLIKMFVKIFIKIRIIEILIIEMFKITQSCLASSIPTSPDVPTGSTADSLTPSMRIRCASPR